MSPSFCRARRAYGLRFAFIALLPAVLVASAAAAPDGPTESAPRGARPLGLDTWTLDNGLKVVFVARQGAPLTSVHIVYHVGSRDEKAGTRGITRVVRELMLQGSPRVRPGGHSYLIARVGGRLSSHGDENVTSFTNTVPTPYVELALALEAERMRGLFFTDETVAELRQAALRARQRQVETSPLGKALELLRGSLFGEHPYAQSGTGHIADLRRLSRADCEAFLSRHFVPANATLVLAGAGDAEEWRRLVDRHFGGLRAGTLPKHPPAPAAHVGQGPRRVNLPLELPMVAVGAPLPALGSRDRAALIVAAEVLGGGSAGRLQTRLVGPQAPAVAAGGASSLYEDAGMLVLFAVHERTRPQEEVRRALLDEVALLRDRPVPAPELAEARLRAATAVAARLSTASGLAAQVGRAAVVEGDPELALSEPEALLDVTATDVGRVANAFLKEDRLSVLLMMPEALGPQERVP